MLGNPDWVVQTLLAHRSQLPLIDTLIERTTVRNHEGRRRRGDKAALLACAYVASKKPSMEQFWKDFGQNKFWELVGFARDDARDEGFEHRPSYRTFYNRITELELDTFIQAFDDAADKLVKIAIEHEPRIGQDVIVDSTRYATPSRSYHCCSKDECPARKRSDKPTVVRLSASDDVDDARHDEAEQPPLSVEEERALRSSKNTWVEGKWRYARHGGCKFRWLDKDAHFRSYTKRDGTKSTVLGGYDMAATDHLTGGVLAGVIFPSNRQEHAAIPALVRRLEQATGRLPETISGDKALTDSALPRAAEDRARLAVSQAAPEREERG